LRTRPDATAEIRAAAHAWEVARNDYHRVYLDRPRHDSPAGNHALIEYENGPLELASSAASAAHGRLASAIRAQGGIAAIVDRRFYSAMTFDENEDPLGQSFLATQVLDLDRRQETTQAKGGVVAVVGAMVETLGEREVTQRLMLSGRYQALWEATQNQSQG
jgi:hypothetical protein